jgi:hypothetical protein
MHMIALFGPGVAARLDMLPDFIRFRMAFDALVGGPGSEIAAWVSSSLDLVVVTALATCMSVARARRVYCEACQSWMRSLMLPAPPGTARALKEALDTGAFDQVGDPGLFKWKLGQETAMLELEYCPPENPQTCSSYLTLKEMYRSANRKMKTETVLKQRALGIEELRAVSEKFPRFRQVLAASSVIAPVSVAEPTVAPLDLAVREEICPVTKYPFHSAWREAFLITLSLAPLITAAGGCTLIGLSWWDLNGQTPNVRLLSAMLGALLALGGGFVTWYNVDWLNHRHVFRLTCDAIRSRADAWVAPEEPQATYVAIVPRKNWGAFNTSSDRGFVMLDPARRRIVFEGILERYRIPASAIHSCELESMAMGGSIYAVVLRCLCQGDGGKAEWEIPFKVDCSGWAKNHGPLRLAKASKLFDRIQLLRGSASA